MANLSMPHEERLLRSAVRANNSNLSRGIYMTGAYSSRPNLDISKQDSSEANKAYDLPAVSGATSPRNNLDRKEERWQVVFNKKSANIEIQQKSIHDQLMKKFKREKENEKRLKVEHAVKAYDDEQRAEKIHNAQVRRQALDA